MKYSSAVNKKMVEIIKKKYKEIQSELIYLDGLQIDVKGAFNFIKKVREVNHKAQKRIKEHLIKLCRLKKKQKALQQVIQVCEMLKVIVEASKAINQLIETDNTHTAIAIIESTEKLIAERIAPVNMALYEFISNRIGRLKLSLLHIDREFK